MSNEIFMSLIHRNVTVISNCKVSSNVKMTMTSWTVIFLNDVFYSFYSNIKRPSFHIRDIWTQLGIIIISYLWKYHFHMGQRVRCLWLWGELVMGFFLDHSLNINHCMTQGGVLLLSTSVTDSLLPLTLQHRTCSCAIKVRELQSDDINGCRWEFKWSEKKREKFCSVQNFNVQYLPWCEGEQLWFCIFDKYDYMFSTIQTIKKQKHKLLIVHILKYG